MSRLALWALGLLDTVLLAPMAALPATGVSSPNSIIISPDNLNPYLKFPVPQLLQYDGVESPGPEVGVMVISLDPTRRGKQIFVSDLSNGAIAGFDGLNGNALVSFSPAPLTGPHAGTQMITAVATEPVPEVNPLGAPVLRPQWIFDEHATGMGPVYNTMRLLDGSARTLWTQTPSNSAYGPMPTPAASFGVIAADGSQDAMLLIDEESFASFGRSGRSGAIDWTAADNYSQQITTPAVMDVNDSANTAFIFCRGRLACLLEKHRVSDGALLWQHDLGSGLLFGYVTVGDPAGLGHDQAILVQRQSVSPFDAVLVVVDGANGTVLWQYDLGEGTNQWGAVPALADLDKDGYPEIVVQTNTKLHVVKFGIGEMPGWPVKTSTSSLAKPVRAEPVIGDLAGDGKQEIAVVSQDADVGYAWGYLDIFDQTGTRRFFVGSVIMPMGAGVVPAIADVDADGHNELLIGSSIEVGSVPEPALWVLDFSLGHPDVKHGAVLWGQHGADAEHSGRALDMHPHVATRPAHVAGIVQTGTLVTVPFALANTGGVDLTWTLGTGVADAASCTDPAAWATFSNATGVLPGAHDVVLQVTLDATLLAPGSYDATICLNSNDAANGALRLPLHLDVVGTSYMVTATASGGGSITPRGAIRVASGSTAHFEIAAPPLYTMTGISGCSGMLNGNEFTTATITADCSVVVNYMPTDRIFTNGFE
jgi:hypothetical protein